MVAYSTENSFFNVVAVACDPRLGAKKESDFLRPMNGSVIEQKDGFLVVKRCKELQNLFVPDITFFLFKYSTSIQLFSSFFKCTSNLAWALRWHRNFRYARSALYKYIYMNRVKEKSSWDHRPDSGEVARVKRRLPLVAAKGIDPWACRLDSHYCTTDLT